MWTVLASLYASISVPSRAASAAICSAVRVLLPWLSMAAVMLARPGRLGGLQSLPANISRMSRFDLDVGIGLLRAARHVVDHLFAGKAVDHHTLVLSEGTAGHVPHLVRGDSLIAGQIPGQVVRIAGVLVVVIEPVCHLVQLALPLRSVPQLLQP